jgi:phosphotransacetylase
MISTFEELEQIAKSKPSRRLAMAEERDALKAAINAAEQGIVEPILTGKERSIREIAEREGIDISPYRIISIDGEEQCAAKAVEAANVFYETLAHLTDAKIAAMTIGANAPFVMSSRADSDTIKYHSILGAVSLV